MRALAIVTALVVTLLHRPAYACLWDNDTLKEESLRHKDVAEVVSGLLRHHGAGFYQQKVAYTRPLIERGNAPKERYDDLAVALARTGAVDEALAVLDAKEARFPGEYTTVANRGAFLAMKGDVTGALEYLKKAVAINPKAHFGREIHQIELLEYMLRLQQDQTLIEREELLGLPMDPEDFAFILSAKQTAGLRGRPTVPATAIQGLVGMIRFGGGEQSPHLWYSLGLALAWQGDKQLAIRAWRRAELLGHPKAAEHGGMLAVTIRSICGQGCGGLGSPGAPQRAWAAAIAKIDREWDKGRAREADLQRKELDLLERGKRRQVFGY